MLLGIIFLHPIENRQTQKESDVTILLCNGELNILVKNGVVDSVVFSSKFFGSGVKLDSTPLSTSPSPLVLTS